MAEAFGADALGILFLGVVFREISVEGRSYRGREIVSMRFLSFSTNSYGEAQTCRDTPFWKSERTARTGVTRLTEHSCIGRAGSPLHAKA